MCQVPADAADEALGVVGASQRRDNLPRDEAVAAVTPRTIQTLVVGRADVLAFLLEEARPSQVTVTHCGRRQKDRSDG